MLNFVYISNWIFAILVYHLVIIPVLMLELVIYDLVNECQSCDQFCSLVFRILEKISIFFFRYLYFLLTLSILKYLSP